MPSLIDDPERSREITEEARRAYQEAKAEAEEMGRRLDEAAHQRALKAVEDERRRNLEALEATRKSPGWIHRLFSRLR